MALPGSVDAVLFDFDHTLVHLGADWEALRSDIAKISERYGVKTDERWVLKGIGVAFRKLVDEGRDKEAAQFRREAIRHVEQVEDGAIEKSTPIDGAVEVVQTLKARGYKVAIVSNNNPGSIGRALQRFGFPPIEHVIGRQNGDPVKPSPIPVLKALSRLDVEAKKAVLVGDGEADLQAAKAAGVASVLFVNNGSEKEITAKPSERIETLRRLLELFPARA